MTQLLLIALLAWQSADDGLESQARAYLERCQLAKAASLKAKEAEIKALEQAGGGAKEKLAAAQLELVELRGQPAALLALPLPPTKGGMGVFAPAMAGDLRGGRSVDVLEMVNEHEAIVRAWYVPTPTADEPSPSEATFVDVWLQGVDARGFKVGLPAKLTQVFRVLGNKTFSTTCGGRNVPLLEPVDVERYQRQER